jgi:chitin-binding protein
MDTPSGLQSPRHGAIIDPPSRATLHLPEEWHHHGLESGKFFPQKDANLQDPYAPEDVPNVAPPEDGQIASAGKSFAAGLDEPGDRWTKLEVSSGQDLTVSWAYHKQHKSRRYNYFLTDSGWDPNAPLSRAQFSPDPSQDPQPIHMDQLSCKPYWNPECKDELEPGETTSHTFTLPQRSGWHVLLAVWEVADTPNAFYQVIDLDFADG